MTSAVKAKSAGLTAADYRKDMNARPVILDHE